MSIPSSWSDDRVKTLTRLWQDGASASQIARSLGGVTRNAVIGKVHRLGLSGRAQPSAPGARPARPARPARTRAARRVAQTRPWSAPALAVGPLPEVGLATIVSVRRTQCRWPIGEPMADDFSLCGRPVGRGAYCAAHGALAYRPVSQKAPADHLLRLAGAALAA
jgi:GcrA cell cycle regulator